MCIGSPVIARILGCYAQGYPQSVPVDNIRDVVPGGPPPGRAARSRYFPGVVTCPLTSERAEASFAGSVSGPPASSDDSVASLASAVAAA